MKYLYTIFCVLISFSVAAQKINIAEGFIENKGQIVDQNGRPNREVRYLLNTPGLNVQLRNDGFSYDVHEPATEKDRKGYAYHRIDVNFVGINKNAKLIEEEKTEGYTNYYNIPGKPEGITGVRSFRNVVYKNVYPDIDAVFFIPDDKSKPVEYNFIIHPGGKIDDIKLRFSGSETNLKENKISIRTQFGEMQETLPASWTEHDSKRELIPVSYIEIDKNTYGFSTGKRIGPMTFVIDPAPVRLWGTYLGSSSIYADQSITMIDTDADGNLYVSGGTNDAFHIATAGSFKSIITGNSDGYLLKLTSGGVRLWGTYYGGEKDDRFSAMSVYDNEVIVGGMTKSMNNITTPAAFKPSLSGSTDGCIIKFNSNGQRIWGTYFGGSDDDSVVNLSTDNNGDFVITGQTYSFDGISTPGSFKSQRVSNINSGYKGEGYVAKFSNDGFRIWGSYYNICEMHGLDIDFNSNIYISGDVGWGPSQQNFTTAGTHQPAYQYTLQTGIGSRETFLVKFSPDGVRLWGTLYGNSSETNSGLKTDHNGNVYISGRTYSPILITTPDSHQPNIGGAYPDPDAYLAKFSNQGVLIWGTYYGGVMGEGVYSTQTIDIDENNNILLFGSTNSSDGISTTNTYDFDTNEDECYIAKFSPQGSRLWGSYFGGTDKDLAAIIKYDKLGVFYIAGVTQSMDNIATPGSLYTTITGASSTFIEKFTECINAPQAMSNSPVCSGSTLNFIAMGGSVYNWTGPNGFISSEQNPAIPNASSSDSGIYSCEISGGDCNVTLNVNAVVGDISPIPVAIDQIFCTGQNATLHNIVISGSGIKWYADMFSTTPLNINTALENNTTYYATQTLNGGCESIRIPVLTTINPTPPSPLYTQTQRFCEDMHATIGDVHGIIGENIRFYDYDGNQLPLTTPLINGGNYRYTQTVNGCESVLGDSFGVTIVPLSPAPSANPNQSFCSTLNPVLSNIATNAGVGIRFYDSPQGGNLLLETQPLVNGQTYYLSQTVECESIDRTAVTVTLVNGFTVNKFNPSICDENNDGVQTVDLSDYQSATVNAASPYTFTYYTSQTAAENGSASNQIDNPGHYDVNNNTSAFVRIAFAGCYAVAELHFMLFPSPVIPLEDSIPICKDQSITLDAGAGFSSYNWSSGENGRYVTISQPGNYSVTVTTNHSDIICSSTKTIDINASDIASISHIETTDWTQNQNTITIDVTGPGDYEYSVDGINFQDRNYFTNLNSGLYNVYIKDKNGCGTATDEVLLFMYPNFFTPNGDGQNDFWNIKFSQLEPGMEIKIFDRYGKFLKQILRNDTGWDGTYNGHALPATDYWFVATPGNGKEYRGHFSLKR